MKLKSGLVPLLALLTRLAAGLVIPEEGVLATLQTKTQKPIINDHQTFGHTDVAFEDWTEQERAKAFELLLTNIGKNAGASPGAVIASPSREHPNYYYQWIRDAAITMGTVVREYEKTGEKDLLDIIEEYIVMQSKLQRTENPSGGYRTGGLGEPKFEVDGTPFWKPWGRRQLDGPALRATTIIDYLRVMNKTEPFLASTSRDWLKFLYDGAFPTFSVIKADLEFVSNVWEHSGFDVWEEVNGLHFFTAMAQLKSLTDGIQIATFFNDTGAAAWYEEQRQKLQIFVHQFWDSSKGHLVSTLHSHRSGMDCAIQLGSLYGGSNDTYPPWSDEVLISMHKLLEDMRGRHKINNESYYGDEIKGWGIGRYPEDVYNGDGTSKGNPWFLCTSSVSEVLYRTISHYLQQGYFEINKLNLAFFKNVYPEAKVGRVTRKDTEFLRILGLLFQWADGFLKVVQRHAKDNYELSEQFDTNQPGYQRGARDLTWSYGSLIEALEARVMAKDQLEQF